MQTGAHMLSPGCSLHSARAGSRERPRGRGGQRTVPIGHDRAGGEEGLVGAGGPAPSSENPPHPHPRMPAGKLGGQTPLWTQTAEGSNTGLLGAGPRVSWLRMRIPHGSSSVNGASLPLCTHQAWERAWTATVLQASGPGNTPDQSGDLTPPSLLLPSRRPQRGKAHPSSRAGWL